jgi:long-chain acyl-CoA synthetase
MYPTLIFGERTHPAAWMASETARLCAGLQAIGCRQGETVAVMLRNGPALVALALAFRQAGLFFVAINWHFKAAETNYLLLDSGAKALFIHDDLIDQVQSGLPESLVVVPVPGDERNSEAEDSLSAVTWRQFGAGAPPMAPRPGNLQGTIVYTSGTTGKPKGVRRLQAEHERQGAMNADSLRINQTVFGVREGDTALLCAPIYHSAPMSYLLHCCAMQATLVLESGFRAEKALELIQRHQVTHAYLVPTMYQRLLALPDRTKERYDVSSLRQVGSTGSPCAPQLKRDMIEWFGPVVTEAYASSETSYITFIDSPTWLAHPGSAGRPLFDARIQIRDDDGAPVPTGQVGVIYARQPAAPDFTYINRPEARTAVEIEGLVTLGDMGYVDDEGFLFVCDRKSDMVISGGVNIYPAEIEIVIQAMPGVADCAVFGIPDEEFGEGLAAAVQLLPGTCMEASDIQSYIRERVANFKVPRIVKFHDELPREDTGKIFKRLLREPYWAGQSRAI